MKKMSPRPETYAKYDEIRRIQTQTGNGYSSICREMGMDTDTFKYIEKERGDSRIEKVAGPRTKDDPAISAVHLQPTATTRKPYTKRQAALSDAKVFVVVTTVNDLQSVIRGLS